MENNQPLLKIWTYLLTSNIFHQDTHRFGTVTKLGLLQMESGMMSYILTSFSGEWMWKLKTREWALYVECYLSLPNPMGNALCYPFLCTKQIFSPDISTSTYHWSEYSTTHYPGITILLLRLLNTLYLLRVSYTIYPHFSLKPPLQSYHDMGCFFLQPRLLPIFKDLFHVCEENFFSL